MAVFVTRTVGDVVAEILMSRANFAGAHLLLEGDTDSKFWGRRIEKTLCQVVIAGGKTTVIGAVVRANAMPVAGVLGIVDDDYDSLCGVTVGAQNVFVTDARDVETMLFKSQALERVIHEIGDAAKVAALEAAEGHTVRNALLKRSLIFGKLRWLDKQKGWKLDFDNLRPFRFGNTDTWTIDEAGVLSTVAPLVNLSVAQLSTALAGLVVADAYSVLHGKDTAAVLAMGLRSKLGNSQHPPERICQMLRLAFDDAMAAATNVFTQVRNWEANNPPYRVLR